MVLHRFAELMAGAPDADTSHPDIQAALARLEERTTDLLDRIVSGPNRDRVFSNLELVNPERSGPIQSTALHLSQLAQDWAAPGSSRRHDEELATVIVEGLRTLHDLQYHADREQFDNWYHWEIGAPRGILETMAILREHVPEDLLQDLIGAVEFHKPDPGFMYPPGDPRHTEAAGSNRLFFCQNVAIAGALARKSDRIQLASDRAVATLTPNLTGSGNGFYTDGSLIAHNTIPYTGTYGTDQIRASSYLLACIGGTEWDLSEGDVQPFRNAIARTFFPWISSAQTLPPVCGRAVANGNRTSSSMMGGILMLAEGAPPEMAREWHAYIKGQLERTTMVNFFQERTLPEALLAQKVMDSDVASVPEDLGPRLFPEMDRILARGEGWCFSLATASRRTRGYETMSEENVKGWHQGSAARYLHVEADQEQYFNWFPVVDPFRMPGTTIDSQYLDYVENSGVTRHHFVGGSQVGGHKLKDGFYADATHASWVQQLSSRDSTMTAKLSWFFLGDVIACLGSDIRGGSGEPIETILENRAKTSSNATPLFVNGRAIGQSVRPGWADTLSDVRSFTVPGTASIIALEGPMDVNFLFEERTGSWADISRVGSATPITRPFHTAWLDHGSLPEGAGFAYLYAPLADHRRGRELERNPKVTVLRNDEVAQAVMAPVNGVVGVNFHDASTIQAGDLHISGNEETSVTVLRDNAARHMEIAFSAPSQQRTQREFEITLPAQWTVELASGDPTLSVTQDGNILTIVLDSSDLDGRSHHLELQG